MGAAPPEEIEYIWQSFNGQQTMRTCGKFKLIGKKGERFSFNGWSQCGGS